jgi:hypothetical protein
MRAAMVAALAALPAGCERTIPRGSVNRVEDAVSGGFLRAYAAQFRMIHGRANSAAAHVVVPRCRPAERRPPSDVDWRWRCDVSYLIGRTGRRVHATYAVVVDPRGCVSASTTRFPARVYERVLGRTVPNRAAHFRSCP